MPIPTRRSFLQTTSLMAAGAACGALRGAAQTPEPAPKLGIQLYSLRGYKLDEALKHASDMGFEQIEFYGGMLATSASDEEIAETKKKVAKLGLSVSGHGVNRLTKDAAENRKIFEVAHGKRDSTTKIVAGNASCDARSRMDSRNHTITPTLALPHQVGGNVSWRQ